MKRHETQIFPTIGKLAQKVSNPWKKRAGFTLVELLSVIAVIGVLAALLVPALSRGTEQARAAKCASNIRQLFVANTLYAAEHGNYVAAAPDILGANLTRWHGTRSSIRQPFDGSRGALYEYLSKCDGIRSCPSLSGFRSSAADNAFESSCGGYGYNDRGVGSQVYWHGRTERGAENGMPPSAIRDPAQTVMFCDAAFPQPYDDPRYLIEYSFAEAIHFVDGQPPKEEGEAQPSIHFRHNARANVVWCDGHVSSETLAVTNNNAFAEWNIGWFGSADNSLFDPF